VIDLIKRAHKFAELAHKDQSREFTEEPYITHPEETAKLLWEVTNGKASDEEYMAAILHDVVEDTSITLQVIGQNFGEEVMSLVKELTTDEKFKKENNKKSYLYESMNTMSEKALNIKLCAILSNVLGLLDERVPIDFIKWCYKDTAFILNNIDRELSLIHKELIFKISSTLYFLKLSKELGE